MPKKYFHDDDVIDDVTGWPQIPPSIYSFLYEITTFFMITKKSSKDIIIKLPVHVYYEIMTTVI